MNISKLTEFFLKNARISLLVTLGLSIWGVFSFFLTPKQYNPRIVAPAFRIYIEYPGKSREDILEQITKPLESLIADIPEVEDVYSVTKNGGYAVLTVNFFVGEDSEKAKITLTDRINSKLNLAPLGIRPPLISSIDPDDVPILSLAIQSNEKSPSELRRFAFKLKEQLTSIEGATNFEIYGGRKKELLIELNTEKLNQKNISSNEIISSIQKQNSYLESGNVKTENKYYPVEVLGEISSEEELKNLNVVISDYGSIKLSEVADVKESISEIEEYIRHISKNKDQLVEIDDIVLVSVAKNKKANISTVSESIEIKLNELKKNQLIPNDIRIEIVSNEGRVAKTEINGLITNLFQSIIIVVIVLVLFLNIRAAILVAISIPLTLFTVFGIGYLAGQNINRITLFALILSLGLLVDNATVVIENIVRRLQLKKQGESKAEVIIQSVEEVGIGLLMSTVTTVLAFIPMAFVTGMMGPYMGPIPFFLPVALIVSLFLSYTINPWMAYLFLEVKTSEITNQWFGKIKNWVSRILDFYKKFLHSVITKKNFRNRTLLIILVLVILSLLLPATALVKFRMLPKANREQFFIYLDLKEGSSLEETFKVAKEIEKEVLKEDIVIKTDTFVGTPPILDFNGLFKAVQFRRSSHQATIRVAFNKIDERKITSEEFVLKIRERLFVKLNSIADKAVLKLIEDPPGPPVLSTFLVRVQSENEELNDKLAIDLSNKIKGISEVVDIDTSVNEESESIQIQIDKERASKSRISVDTITSTISTYYSGSIVGIYHNKEALEQEFIRVRMDKKQRKDWATIKKIFLHNDLGIKVPLQEIVKIQFIKTKSPILRENRKTTSYVYAEMGNRSVTYAGIDLLKILWYYTGVSNELTPIKTSLFGVNYKTKEGNEIEISIGGEWELTLEVFRDLGIAMGFAIFMIYFVLVAQFASFREPIIILSTIPLSLVGVLPGFMILYSLIGLYFTATSMIGVIALAGIAVNNSIILLEYLNSLKEQNIPLEEALLEAGVTRFRPIMLTTITTILGSLTIISDPVWAGLAYALVFGLGISSLLTLVTFPALYQILKGRDWKKIV
jgi:multidrug efflux pump subunit AcrB